VGSGTADACRCGGRGRAPTRGRTAGHGKRCRAGV